MASLKLNQETNTTTDRLKRRMRELIDLAELEKEITCSLCEKLLTEPRQFQCLHSFCLKCIQTWSETCKSQKQRLLCPTCREPEPDDDVSKLRSSSYLEIKKQSFLAMRTYHDDVSKQGKKQLDCVSCDKPFDLVGFCQQCKGLICTDCAKTHNNVRQLRDQHCVIMFIDFEKEHSDTSNEFYCKERFHADERLEYYCHTCGKCICGKCSNTSHATHDKISIEEKAQEKKQEISKNIHDLIRRKQKFVQELEQSKQNVRRIENEIKQAKQHVSDVTQAQIKLLLDHKCAIIDTLYDILRDQKQTNADEQKEVDAVIQQFSELINEGKNLQYQNVHCLVLEDNQLPQKCEELLQKPSVLSTKPITRNTNIQYVENSRLTQCLEDIGAVVQSIPDPSSCYVKLHNEEIRCGFVNTFEIVTTNSKAQVCHTNIASIDVQITDNDGLEVGNKIIENKTGKYLVSYKAEKLSPYKVVVRIAGITLANSPITVRTTDAISDFKPVKIESFECPTLVAVNHENQVVTLDIKRGHITILNEHRECLRRYECKVGREDHHLHKVSGIVMSGNTIFISDNHPQRKYGRIQALDVSGEFPQNIFSLNLVECHVIELCCAGDEIAVLSVGTKDDADGIVHIAITLVSKQDGQIVREIAITDTTEDENLPYGIAYDNNKYFISYSGLNHIEVYADNGTFLYRFGEKGKGKGQLDNVNAIAVYSNQMLLASDYGNNRVQIFSQDGNFIKSIGKRFGQVKSPIRNPVDLAVAPDGKIFVLEDDAMRVQVWQ